MTQRQRSQADRCLLHNANATVLVDPDASSAGAIRYAPAGLASADRCRDALGDVARGPCA